MTESSLVLAPTWIKPLALPVAESIAAIAWYSCVRGTQCGGYLNRAVSRIRTMSCSAWNPPIGLKWPSPAACRNHHPIITIIIIIIRLIIVIIIIVRT